MIKDFGAQLDLLSGTGARGLAGGTGDATEVLGAIVDTLAQPGIESGCIVVCGTATLADTKVLDLGDIKIEHGDETDLSDAADFSTPVDLTSVAVGDTGGTTELFGIKINVPNMAGCKRYWRIAFTPDCDATGTDTFSLGAGFIGYGRDAPHASDA